MRQVCIDAVRAAAGARQISAGKLQAIEDALSSKMRELARRDRQRWQGLTRDQRMAEAAAAAMEDIQAQAARKEHNAALQVLKADETNHRVADLQALTKTTRSRALVQDIENTHDYQAAIRNDAIAHLGDMLDAAGSRDGTGPMRNLGMRIFDLDNPAMTLDVVREVFKGADGHTGNAAAKAGAKAWLDTIEALRQRFNAAGGDVGKLAYGYLSQAHDRARVLEAGADAWAAKVLPLLDREQYVRTDGTLMSDGEVADLLRGAWETVSSGGDNKVAPGQFKGSGARANRGSESRVLHFRDGDAWVDYMRAFGEGSLYDAMLGHLGSMSRDIGLVERYGPNPEAQFRVQADIAERADGKGSAKNRAAGNTPEAYWALISGRASTPENTLIAQIGSDIRNVQTAAKLGGAVLSSTTDVATVAASLHYNRLPYFTMLAELVGQVSRAHRQFLQAHAIIGESLTSTLNRWTGDHLTHSLTGRVAGSVMKLSLMNAWTDGLRNAFAATMMRGFASKLGKTWGDLDEWDRFLMQRKGITEGDWAVISQAQPTMRDGHGYLTHEAVAAVDGGREAATKWLGFVTDEAQFAVINPDLATRSIVTGGGMPAGTVRGEAMRSFMQFKSFPLAMLTRHWRRIFDTPQGLQGAPAGFGAQTAAGAAVNRIAVLAGLNVSLMLLGALVMQNKALVSGKDPYDMTEGKFWMRALAQGGGAGYLGDLLFKDPTEQRSSTTEQTVGTILGPGAGAVAGLVGDLGVVNAWEAAKGKDTHFGAEALRWGNSQLPYVGLWQTRAAWEHWFLHNAQEAVNPGYLARMQQRAQKDWGQGYWWVPGEAAPDRAPDMGRMVGQ